MRFKSIAALFLSLAASAHAGGPYPAFGGISASADDASVAGQNPAGMTRFDRRVNRFELMGFFSDSTWEGQLGEDGPIRVTEDDSTTVVPSGAMVIPIRDKWWFGFTMLGMGASEDYDDDFVGRYFNSEYDLLYLSAFPSIATKVTDRLSVAASLALTYVSYEQDNAIPNLEPGAPDGNMNIDADDVAFGFGLSAMYDLSDRTRLGLIYRSEIDPELDGKISFSGLGPIAQTIVDQAGLQNSPINVSSKRPQAVTAGVHHDFENRHTLTLDALWTEFSSFQLAEIYFDGNKIEQTAAEYDDIFALSAAYSWPVADRWRVGIGGAWVDDMIEDEKRTMTLRLDSVWGLGVGVEWQWKPDRTITATLNYFEIDEAPVTREAIGGLGVVNGRYTDRGSVVLRVALSLGPDRG